MTSAYILIAVVLVLGGLIAALGDRLGTKVGKARLRLFNLRPRQTAALVTVITGTLISASTLLVLFGLSESLREGVFQLDDILKKRRALKAELERTRDEREEIEDKLEATQREEAQAQQGLDETKQKFQDAQKQLKTFSEQGSKLRRDINTLLSERQELFKQRRRLSQEIQQFKEQVTKQDRQIIVQKSRLQEQQRNLQQRTNQLQEQEKRLQEQKISLQRLQNQQKELVTEIAQRDSALKQKQANLEALVRQLTFLQQAVETLERNYQGFRGTDIAITRSQVLASRVIQVDHPVEAQQAVKEVLWLANQVAMERTLTGNFRAPEPIVKITNAQVKDLINYITDGREYVVRILSASNYVKGENQVNVFADVLLNQEVFQTGEVIAAISVDVSRLSIEDIQEQLDWLMAASQFRARRAGILGSLQVEDGNLVKLITFIDQLSEYEEPVEEIRAIAPETIHTAGPLKIRLVAIKDGKVVFST